MSTKCEQKRVLSATIICFLVLAFTMLQGCGEMQLPAVLSGKKPVKTPAMAKTMYVKAWALNMRACPGMKCKILAVLKQGQTVHPSTERAGWFQVSVVGGRQGWVAASYLSAKPQPVRRDQVACPTPATAPAAEPSPTDAPPPPEAGGVEPAPMIAPAG